jgi:hypothetical protein
VRAATLKSGTFSLDRDLPSPGGITNILPGAVGLGGIGAPGLGEGLLTEPAGTVSKLLGDRATVLQGDVNQFPILMVDGFFDVESPGAFQAYQALKDLGAHLYVIGGHDGHPKGTDGLAERSRAGFEADRYVQIDATDWPVPGTRWESWALTPAHALSLHAPARTSTETYPAVESSPLTSDPPDIAVADASGLSALTNGFPALENIGGAEELGLTYTTPPLGQNLYSAGPAAPRLRAAADQLRQHHRQPVARGPRNNTHAWTCRKNLATTSDRPELDLAEPGLRGRVGALPAVVDDRRHGMRSCAVPRTLGASRTYTVRLTPRVGMRSDSEARARTLARGMRERWRRAPSADGFATPSSATSSRPVTGSGSTSSAASLGSEPSLPALNTVTLGGSDRSRLLLPVIPAH